jgi:two-component system, chemotaxis family, protein-glutamate methylesterase/glutaminase
MLERESLEFPCANRCVIAIGASEGGVEALGRLVRELPADLPAAVLIVLHVGPTSRLAEVLAKSSRMPVADALNGQALELSRIYVAPPGHHLLVHENHMLLRRGPRENLSRPAIDPLFRSIACSYGGSAIAVVLTGNLSEGTAGLRAIKTCGGTCIVQDPNEAIVPDMPLSALRAVDVDHCLPIAAMPDILVRLAGSKAGPTPTIPTSTRLEVAIAAQELGEMNTAQTLGELSVFVCPECQGQLWEIEDGPITRYRCHTGHAFSEEIMMEAQTSDAERILWTLLRSHQQRAEFARRAAVRERARKKSALAVQLQQRAIEYDADAKLVERFIHEWHSAPRSSLRP